MENIFIDQTIILVTYALGDEDVRRAYNAVRFDRRVPRQVYAVNPHLSRSRMGLWRNQNVEILCDSKGNSYDALAFFADLDRHLGVPGPTIVSTEPTPSPTIPLPAQRYLTYLIDLLRPLTFQGIVQLERAAVTLNVDDLYVTLYATAEMPRAERVEGFSSKKRDRPETELRERASSEPLRIEDALKKHNALVVLGHPGAGKPTLLRYLAVIFAQVRAEERLGLQEQRVPFLDVHIRPSTLNVAAAVFGAARDSLAEVSPGVVVPSGVHDRGVQFVARGPVPAFQQGTAFEFATVSAEGCYLGGCGLNQIDKANQRANLGYWTRSTAIGRGVATAASGRFATGGFRTRTSSV